MERLRLERDSLQRQIEEMQTARMRPTTVTVSKPKPPDPAPELVLKVEDGRLLEIE